MNMILESDTDIGLIETIQQGMPLVSRPYAAIGERIGLTEAEVIDRIQAFQDNGIIKRFGVIVRHHELGYQANAMVVWNVADHRVAKLGKCIGQFDFVTLCYQRRRSLPEWPYNLYCMIHGRDRETVLSHLSELISHCRIQELPCQVLFSQRRFKQRGAVYCSKEKKGRRQALAGNPLPLQIKVAG